MNKKKYMLLIALSIIYNTLFCQGSQENRPNTKINLFNRYVICLFEISIFNDSTIQLKQEVFNTNNNLSLYVRPAILCRNPGVFLPGDTNDLLVYSDGRLIFYSLDFNDSIEIFKIPPKESRVFYDKYRFSGINKIEWVNIKTNHVFETSDFNSNISFIKEVESVDGRNRPVKTSVFLVNRKLFNENSNFSDVFCSGIDLLRNRVNKLE